MSNIGLSFSLIKSMMGDSSDSMIKSFWNIISVMKEYNVTMRDAAYIMAVGRVAESLRLLGRCI